MPAGLAGAVGAILVPAGIPFDPAEPLQLRRVIGQSSVRNYVNDTPVSARLLASVGEQLIDLHGANEQLSLTVPARQLDLLDRYAGAEEAAALCGRIAGELEALAKEREEFDRQTPDEAEPRSRLELQLEDIDKVNPAPGEDEELSARFKVAGNSRQVLETAGQLTAALTEGEDSVADRLGSVYRRLLELSRIDEALAAGLLEECDRIQEDVSALSGRVAELADKVDLDRRRWPRLRADWENCSRSSGVTGRRSSRCWRCAGRRSGGWNCIGIPLCAGRSSSAGRRS